MATNSTAPGSLDYSLAQEVIDALVDSDVSGYWQDASAALWLKACITAGRSKGVAGCPSLELAEYAYAVMGA
ncbi:MAG: hypothetical protein ACHP8B_14135 [Terriglobales bacterium]